MNTGFWFSLSKQDEKTGRFLQDISEQQGLTANRGHTLPVIRQNGEVLKEDSTCFIGL